AAMAGIRADKQRDATDGYDGGWVAHPGLVPVAKAEFDAVLGSAPNQIEKQRDDISVTAADLLNFQPEAPITEAGLRMNINVGIQYLGSWISGNGCVPIHNLMEDAATAEISRSQIWQWIRSPKGVLEDGRKVTTELFRELQADEVAKLKAEYGNKWTRQYEDAARMFDLLTTSDDFVEFLTLPGYEYID
ncbi:malate synthase A, partial [Laribacter hongkongensis]|nr:malate synthase A [Laribacter hongkongensis]MCG9020785.1 malate synthase A [Laribacter hongkongensis]